MEIDCIGYAFIAVEHHVRGTLHSYHDRGNLWDRNDDADSLLMRVRQRIAWAL